MMNSVNWTSACVGLSRTFLNTHVTLSWFIQVVAVVGSPVGDEELGVFAERAFGVFFVT